MNCNNPRRMSVNIAAWGKINGITNSNLAFFGFEMISSLPERGLLLRWRILTTTLQTLNSKATNNAPIATGRLFSFQFDMLCLQMAVL